MAEIITTETAASVAGSSKADTVFSGDQNTRIVSGAGDDRVFSGAGNDIIEAGADNDLLAGGKDDDTLSGGTGNDIVLGGAGNDLLAGDAGDDILSGGSGADTFQYKSGFGSDIITDLNFVEGDKLNFYSGAAGNGRNVTITNLSQLISFANSNGTVSDAGKNAVKIDFGSGNSLTLLGYGDEFGFAAPPSPNSTGTGGDDIVLGTGIAPSGGAKASDVGGKGIDTVLAGGNGDNVQGNDGDDVLIGGAGDDLIGGQAGNDVLFGNAGNDQLAGGDGNDILQGDDGADTFLFKAGFGNDTITDFDFSEGDILSFVGAAPGGSNAKITSADQLMSFVADNSLTTTTQNDSVTIDFGGGNSLRLIGVNASTFA